MADFANGMILKTRNPGAPDYVVAKVSLKVDEFKETLDKHNKNGWVNVDLLISQAGKPYTAIDDWEPNGQSQAPRQPAQTPQAAPPPPFPEAAPQEPRTPPLTTPLTEDEISDIPF